MSVSALDIETVPHGIATPFGGNDPKTMTFGGCLYRQDGTKVALSERPFGPGYNFRPDNPEILDPLPPETPVLSGRSLYANARVIAGLTGSALHNSLFMVAGGLMIELQYPGFYDDKAVVTQALCNDVAGIAGIFVSFKGFAMPGSRALHYDTAQIEKALPEDLAPDAATTGRMRRLTHRLRGALEIAMLDVLPVVRGAAGRLRRLLRTGARRSKA